MHKLTRFSDSRRDRCRQGSGLADSPRPLEAALCVLDAPARIGWEAVYGGASHPLSTREGAESTDRLHA